MNTNPELKKLQDGRTKANVNRKPNYQKKIDSYFFDNSKFVPAEVDDWSTSWERTKN